MQFISYRFFKTLTHFHKHFRKAVNFGAAADVLNQET